MNEQNLIPTSQRSKSEARELGSKGGKANDYNPNSVASIEMELLYVSISHDGYTQPIVTVYDKELGKYIIVDGFHRYFIAKAKADISKRINGRIPIVVIDKDGG